MLTNWASFKPRTPTPSTVSARWSRVALQLRRPSASCTTTAARIMTSPRRPCKLIDVRQIAPTVIILQASWKSPVMNPDGKLDLTKQDSMMVTYTLLKEAGGWRATQTDLHNVEKMDLPYSSAEQKS